MLNRPLITTLLAALIFAIAPSRALAEEPPPVSVRFLGATSLEELARGADGNGMLLYYAGGRGIEQPSLVVRLNRAPDQAAAIAEVFDAPPGMTYVPIRTDGNTIAVDPNLRPSITIRALDGWWVRNGIVNYNLDIQVNGPIYALWGGGYDPKDGPTSWTGRVAPGEPAARITVRDAAGSGLPTWDLRALLPDFGRSGFLRTNYAEQTCTTPLLVDLGVSPLWPFVARDGAYEQPIGTLRPPIVVDWPRGKITHFSELVTVRNQNCSYSFYSLNDLVPGEHNQPDFETLFAFYDLSGQGRGLPNLILRTARFPANDPWSTGLEPKVQQGRPVPTGYEQVRYSWRLAPGDGLWDYKIEVLGFHPYTGDTAIGNGYATIDAPSYAAFPGWVVDQSWPAVSFIDTEGKSHQSSEGIYDWPPSALGIGYLLGWQTEPSDEAFATIPLGFRGEYRFRHDLPPRLYLSPIDNRLHLLESEGGLWKLNNTLMLQCLNLNEDAYIDAWVRGRVIEPADGNPSGAAGYSPVGSNLVDSLAEPFEEALYAFDGYLLYTGPTEVEVRRASYQLAAFEITPPTNKETWAAFRDRIAPYAAQRRDPNDLKSWLTPFSGNALTVSNARITQVRSTPSGFRFVLMLGPAFQTNGAQLLAIQSLEPGTYAVTYDGQFRVEPLTPPSISGTISSAAQTALIPAEVDLRLQNDGLTDLSEATLELWAAAEDHPAKIVATRPVALLSGEPITAKLAWAPPSAGTWTLTVKLRPPDEVSVSVEPIRVTVGPAESTDISRILAISAPDGVVPTALGGLVIVGLTLAWILGRQLYRNPSGEGDDAA